MAPSPIISQIKALGDSFSQLKEEYEAEKKESERRDKVLYEKIRILTIANKDLSNRVANLEGVSYDLEQDGDGDVSVDPSLRGPREGTGATPGADDVSGGSVENNMRGDMHQEEMEKAERSCEAADSTVIKALVQKVFSHLMGLSKIDGKSLFAHAQYPYGIDPSSNAYPHEITTENNVETRIQKIRFDWNLGGHDEPNKKHLNTIKDYCILRGAAFHRPAASQLAVVTEDDLLGRIQDKYKYMRGEFGKAKKKQNQEDEAALDESIEESSNRGHMKSRAKAKLEARLRKRAASAYKDIKYDSAFIINAMSDDDDDPDHEEGQPRHYVSVRPSYRSDIAHQLYVDVDALKDPNPDKAVKAYPRKRPTDPETVKEGNPPIGNTLATKLRVWQIVPTVLEANPHWLTNHRILANGIPWGDESDPVLPNSKKRKAKLSAAPQAKPKKPKPAAESSEAADAAGRLSALMGEDDEDSMFARASSP